MTTMAPLFRLDSTVWIVIVATLLLLAAAAVLLIE
jgi:hypothetical protein